MKSIRKSLGGMLLVIGAVLFLIPTASSASVTPVPNAFLHDAEDQIGATNPGFEEGECPDGGDLGTWGWHFVLPGNETTFVSISVTFLHEGVVTEFISFPTGKHAYVYTHQADTLLGASAVVDGPETVFNLSHVCPGEEENTTTTTEGDTTTTVGDTTTTVADTTTTVAETTTTAAATTTVPAETTTTVAATTTTAAAETTTTVAAAIPGPTTTVPRGLAFTGSNSPLKLFLALGLVLAGGACLLPGFITKRKAA